MKTRKSNSTSLAVAFAAAVLAVGAIGATATNMVYSINSNNTSLAGPQGEKCFYGCSALETITLKHVAFNLGQAAFYGIKSDFVLTYPSRTASQFKTYCSTKAPFRNPDGDDFTEGTIKCLDSIKVSSLDD